MYLLEVNLKVNIWKPNLEPITRVKNLFLCISYKSRKHLIRYGVLQSLTVFLDLIGIAAIGVVGSMTVSGITSSQLNPNVANFLDWIGIKSFSLTYQVSVIAMIGGLLLISRSILSYTLSLRIYKLLASDSANLSSHLIKKIFNKDIANIGEYTKQEIVFILTSGTNKAVLDVVGSAILMIADFFTLILILLVLFIVDTPSAILTLAIFGVLSVVLFRNLKDRAGRLGKLNGDLFVEVNNSIIEGLDNIRVIKTSNFTKHVLANFDAVRLKQAKIQSELSIIPYISKYYFEVVLVFGAILVSAFQFIVYDSAHAITALTIFLASASRVVPATLRLQQNALAIRASIAYTEPVLLLLTEEAIGKEEIDRMVQDAEANSESDKKARTLIETRNSAEAQMHEVKKDFEEFKSELTEAEITELETVIKSVEEAAKGDDAEKITEELNKIYPAMKTLLEKKQAKEQAEAQTNAQPQGPAQDDVVDATFTEKKAD